MTREEARQAFKEMLWDLVCAPLPPHVKAVGVGVAWGWEGAVMVLFIALPILIVLRTYIQEMVESLQQTIKCTVHHIRRSESHSNR